MGILYMLRKKQKGVGTAWIPEIVVCVWRKIESDPSLWKRTRCSSFNVFLQHSWQFFFSNVGVVVKVCFLPSYVSVSVATLKIIYLCRIRIFKFGRQHAYDWPLITRFNHSSVVVFLCQKNCNLHSIIYFIYNFDPIIL